ERHFNELRAGLQAGEWLDAPRREALLAHMAEADDSPYASSRKPDNPGANTLEWLGEAEDEAQNVVSPKLRKEECRDMGCLLWAVDLDGDGRNEVLLLSPGVSNRPY